MTNRVRDVLRELTGADFRSDVQLADYWSPHNLDLLRNYIFTTQATVGKKSSVDLLQLFCEAFTPGTAENRFVVLATYGHGKSHFALMIANYFGRENGSAESVEVIEAIRHAVSDQDSGKLGFIEDFKKQHEPFLILILRGDEPNELPTKIHKALKLALENDPQDDGGSELPFWFNSAEDFITRIGPEQKDVANQYLANHNLDIESLFTKVKEKDTKVRDICADLVFQLTGIHPNFEKGVSLAEVIKWVVDNKCGPGKQYAGLIVLFDEFSAFIANYCSSNILGADLQDLLNGIADAREKAAFIALAQRDPNEIVRTATLGKSPIEIENIEKELGRLPQRFRFQLHSSLEEVLESYLRKRDEVWLELLGEDKDVKKWLLKATQDAWEAFQERYAQGLKWDVGRFDELVTKGCYPLHPLTTALLCSVELQTTLSPRTVLGFVLEAVDRIADNPIFTESGPTWVRAVSLVDYFERMLDEQSWQLYTNALRTLSQPDQREEILVLKAMLLLQVGQVSTRKRGYAYTIAELSGLPIQETDQILAGLSESSIVRKDPVTGNYTISPSGWGEEGEKIAKLKMQNVKLDTVSLEAIRNDLLNLGLKEMPMNMGWGHQDDWAAEQILLVRNNLTDQYLKGVQNRYLHWMLSGGAKKKSRGLVMWLIANNEEDVEWYRNQLPDLLNNAVGEARVPLIMMRPKAPNTTLIERLKRYIVLQGFTPHERTEAGPAWLNDSFIMAQKNLTDALASYQASDCIAEVPTCFKAGLDSIHANDLNQILRGVFQMAYPSVAPWFDQYRVETTHLVTAVSQICSKLSLDGKIDGAFLGGKPVAFSIVHRYLIEMWQIMNKTGRPKPPPDNSPIFPSWDAIEKHFPEGGSSANVGQVLEVLLNSPFGLDWNVLSIVLITWLSYRRYDLEKIGDSIPWEQASRPLKPRELLEKWSTMSIRHRVDPTEDIRRLLEDIRSANPRSQSDARAQQRNLEEFIMGRTDPNLKENATDALNRLKEATENAVEYDNQATQIIADSQKNNLNEMLSCLAKVQKLPIISSVKAESPAPNHIREGIRQRIGGFTDNLCVNLSRLKQLSDYVQNVGQLKQASNQLEKAGLDTETQKIRDAIGVLEKNKKQLEGEFRLAEQRIHQESIIKTMSVGDSISQLRDNISKLTEMNPSTEVEQLLTAKRNDMVQELTRLTDFANSFSSSLDQSVDQNVTSKLRDEVIRVQNRYDDSEIKQKIETGILRCDSLLTFFNDLEIFKNVRYVSPEEFDEAIRGVQIKIDEASKHLSALQKKIAESIIQTLYNGLAHQRQQAKQLLDDLKHKLENEIISKLQQEFEGINWSFLPPEEEQSLQDLKNSLQSRIDGDESQQVELHFRKIRDKKLRQKCLEGLQLLIEEDL